ncbi:unnamed protein product [Anisakis simplex]|uniref:Peptidase_M14 domain-containing protein n=1 Tax=Anisakis simplex TaxID=6269 RepID=A0A0M3K8W5_ANISI|nr:unnamed protein product [Anisakis simplex]
MRVYLGNGNFNRVLDGFVGKMTNPNDQILFGSKEGKSLYMGVDARSQRNVLEHLKREGFSHSILRNLIQNDLRESLSSERGRFKCAQEPQNIDTASYHRFEEIECYLTAVQKKYPRSTELIEIGTSFHGRSLTAIKISDGTDNKKIAAFINAGMHADQWISPASAVYAINELTENASKYRDILSQMDVYVMPVNNPDGYRHSWDSMPIWTKTRSGPYHLSCRGVDLNRNWDIDWKDEATATSCLNEYPGPVAFSEPESRALAEFLQDNNDTIRVFIDIHSHGTAVLYPFANTDRMPSNINALKVGAERAAKAMKSVNGTEFAQASVGAWMDEKTGGMAIDYAKQSLNIEHAYAIHLRPARAQPQNGVDVPSLAVNKIRVASQEGWAGVSALLKYVASESNGQKS